VLSVIQLTLGVTLGCWFVRRRPTDSEQTNVRAKENQRAATRLLEWTREMAENVHDHSGKIDDVEAQLARFAGSEIDGSEAYDHEVVVGLVHHLSTANAKLHDRLNEAETNLRYQEAEFQAQLTEARTDSLTGLANRRSFDEELVKRFDEWRRYGREVSLMLLDIDRFKDVNDEHGHLTGDAVLRQLAEVLGDARTSDIVTRYGGEEFAIILPHTSLEESEIAAERLRLKIAETVFRHEELTLRTTISYGLAQFEDSDEVAEAMVARADAALYASKVASRNCGHAHNGRVCVRVRASDSAGHEAGAVAEAADTLR